MHLFVVRSAKDRKRLVWIGIENMTPLTIKRSPLAFFTIQTLPLFFTNHWTILSLHTLQTQLLLYLMKRQYHIEKYTWYTQFTVIWCRNERNVTSGPTKSSWKPHRAEPKTTPKIINKFRSCLQTAKKFNCSRLVRLFYYFHSVKPVIVVTSIYRPLVYNGHLCILPPPRRQCTLKNLPKGHPCTVATFIFPLGFLKGVWLMSIKKSQSLKRETQVNSLPSTPAEMKRKNTCITRHAIICLC